MFLQRSRSSAAKPGNSCLPLVCNLKKGMSMCFLEPSATEVILLELMFSTELELDRGTKQAVGDWHRGCHGPATSWTFLALDKDVKKNGSRRQESMSWMLMCAWLLGSIRSCAKEKWLTVGSLAAMCGNELRPERSQPECEHPLMLTSVLSAMATCLVILNLKQQAARLCHQFVALGCALISICIWQWYASMLLTQSSVPSSLSLSWVPTVNAVFVKFDFLMLSAFSTCRTAVVLLLPVRWPLL